MWRGLLILSFVVATANSAWADDLETCRDSQAELGLRQSACAAVIAGGRASGKSLAVAYQVRGEALAKKRDADGAIAAFSAAHDADPDNVNYLNGRGIAYGNKGDDEHALADFDAMLQTRPGNFNALNNRGWILMRKGDAQSLRSALEAFTAAVKSNSPSRYIAFYNRARVLTVNKSFDAALADFAEAQRINAATLQVQNYRCVTYAAMGQFDLALADCNEVLAKSPKATYTLVSRGNAYLGKGDLVAALADFNAALALNPNYIRAYAGRGQLYEKRGDPGRARADYRSASSALTRYDDLDVGIARAMAKARLAALAVAAPPTPSSKPANNAPAPASRRIALIIGNGAYKNVPQLANPPRDAKLMAAALHDVGFQAVTLAGDLGRDKFFAALQAFALEAEKADWAVVYYAGHGLEIGGVNYLVPVDARLAADRDAETEAVALEQVIAAVGGARKLRLVLLDACRDDPFETRMQKTIALKLVTKGLSNIEPEAGYMVVYAAKHGETALDGDATNSPFAVAVARDIREPRVEVRKLFDIVRDDVWASSKHQQQPFTYGSPPGREDFYFVAGK